ncbi:MAG: hypothetical protein N2738_06910, partial [Thermodesulfovibrionales bacterium]|nr:hypothetical protein [Thermodesulfovibrionales bacterium]
MKKFYVEIMVFGLIAILLLAFFVSDVKAEQKFTVTFPMETGATAFWFPSDGTYAMGLAHTFMRVQHSSLPKVQLDFDATIAQEVNNDK